MWRSWGVFIAKPGQLQCLMTCQNCRAVPIVLVFLPASNNSCIRITTLCMVGCSRINHGENLAGKGKRNSPISWNNHSLQLKEQIYKNLHLEFLPHQLCQIVHVLTTTTYKTNTCSFLHSAGKKKLMGFGHLIFHCNSTSDSFNSIPGSRTDMLCFGKMSSLKKKGSLITCPFAWSSQPPTSGGIELPVATWVCCESTEIFIEFPPSSAT